MEVSGVVWALLSLFKKGGMHLYDKKAIVNVFWPIMQYLGNKNLSTIMPPLPLHRPDGAIIYDYLI